MAKFSRLIYANSMQDADLLYACKFQAPDPFAFLQHRGKKYLLLSDLELDRGRSEAKVDRVDSLSKVGEGLKKGASALPDMGAILIAWLRSFRLCALEVPANFPLALARQLEGADFQLKTVAGTFCKERQVKSPSELKALRKILRITETGMERGWEVLKQARVRKDRTLVWKGTPLTSARLRAEIDAAILYAGGQPGGTIVAGGEQACDPHERGHGPLRANELIILDIFPRDPQTGFFGDLTRTVVRGKASQAQRHLWETCLEGQKFALRSLRPGAKGSDLHETIKDRFSAAGYPTEQRSGRWCGFFHGTGHGLGLDLHEEPRFAATIFQAGQVFTIEPGLYYPGLGGVRHEDVATVTPSGRRVLTRLPKVLEI